MGEYFEMENGRWKVTDKFREAMAGARTISLNELESMSDSKLKIACKKTWNFTKNTIRKGMELQVKVIKDLKRLISY